MLNKKKKIVLSDKKGINDADFSVGYKYFVNRFTNLTTPNLVTLNDIKGKEIRVIEDNKELLNKIAGFKIAKISVNLVKTLKASKTGFKILYKAKKASKHLK